MFSKAKKLKLEDTLRARYLPEFLRRKLVSLGARQVGVVAETSTAGGFIDLLRGWNMLAGVYSSRLTGEVSGERVRPLTEMTALPPDTVIVLLTVENPTRAMQTLHRIRENQHHRILTYVDLTAGYKLVVEAFERFSPFHKLEFVLDCHMGQAVIGGKRLYEAVDLKDKVVMELGPLDTAMSGSILQFQPKQLKVVECYWENYLKCAAIKEGLCISNLDIIYDDIHNVLGSTHGVCDVLFAHGVIYHSHEPIQLCEQLATIAPKIVVGVPCSSSKPEKTRTWEWRGKKWTAELGLDASKSVGGPGEYLCYFNRQRWQGIFEELGFSVHEIRYQPVSNNGRDYYQFLAVRENPSGT